MYEIVFSLYCNKFIFHCTLFYTECASVSTLKRLLVKQSLFLATMLLLLSVLNHAYYTSDLRREGAL